MNATVRPSPLDVIRNGRPDSEFDNFSGLPRRVRFAKVLDRIKCADGFDLSVQAGEYLYSTPRDDRGPWSHVEVGYPSARPEPWAEWEPYCEEPERPVRTVYAYVPLTLVEALIESHGGPA